ncbi:hypothetical protein KUH03_18920 [Sphingobacterium sp. E70]|uniref:hypothetical protein n=1 Tax=Sphingobacterium sp. E70 TaxID=2853439 RepID=UPI00211CC7AE|nr:hypothetical protein [Sphingobacterium sp. E70]ULT28437.1 hypothetical protein KUH03_18920 [Sphingobacterium sp. E70]
MKKKVNKIWACCLILLGFISTPSFGQEYQEYKDVAWNEPRSKDSAYYAMREKASIPLLVSKGSRLSGATIKKASGRSIGRL